MGVVGLGFGGDSREGPEGRRKLLGVMGMFIILLEEMVLQIFTYKYFETYYIDIILSTVLTPAYKKIQIKNSVASLLELL